MRLDSYNKIELENLRQVYLGLYNEIDLINNNINNLVSKIDILSIDINNNFKINDKFIDNGLLKNSKEEFNSVYKFLKCDVKNEIFDLIIKINEQLNS